MISLYYTGGNSYLGENYSPKTTSLGGFISTTPIDSGESNSLFPNISQRDVENKKSFTIAIALKNIGSEVISNLRIWSELNSKIALKSKILIAVAPFISELKVENIKSIYSTPLNASFIETSIEEPIRIPTFIVDEYLVLWIKKEYIYNEEDIDLDNIELIESLIALQEQKISEELTLFIEYD